MRTLNALSAADQSAASALVDAVRAMLGADLKCAILFGSRARGDGHRESDLDVALVVSPRGRSRRRDIYDLAYDLSLAHGVELAPTVIDEANLQNLRDGERLFAAELDRDGILL